MVDRIELWSAGVVLEPLELAHVDGLVAAASEDRSTYAFTWVPHDVATMTSYVETALADEQDGWSLPFAIRLRASERIVGTSRFLDIDYWTESPLPDVVEIGSTWLAASVQGTHVNPEIKLLMLGQHVRHVGRGARDVQDRRAQRAVSPRDRPPRRDVRGRAARAQARQ